MAVTERMSKSDACRQQHIFCVFPNRPVLSTPLALPTSSSILLSKYLVVLLVLHASLSPHSLFAFSVAPNINAVFSCYFMVGTTDGIKRVGENRIFSFSLFFLSIWVYTRRRNRRPVSGASVIGVK
jgi:hypothetical protein